VDSGAVIADGDGLAKPISFDARYGAGVDRCLVLGGGGIVFVAWLLAYLRAGGILRGVNPFALEGKTALVTGASRGIGAATARALDRAGARVALTGRAAGDLAEVASGLAHEPIVIVGDLRDAEAPAQIAERALAALGAVDVLVNNAATAARLDTVDTDAALVDEMLAVNVRAPLLLIGGLVPSMSERGGGSIVNVSSVSGVVGTPRRAAYAASKGALDAMTRSLAAELGPQGIRVNAVAPGVVDTALWAKNKAIPGVVEGIEQQTPLRRWAVAEDIADVIVFLASDAARMITGETISADGGMARTLDLYGGAV
jgi:NAD(P)-dependent dehydrogenase (short-subunit alcohol dehydrogenase family)